MSLNLDGFIRVQLVHINDATGLLELAFELLTNRNDIAILDNLLRELVEELLLRQWVEAF